MFKPTYEKELKKLDKKYPYKDSKEYKELVVELNFKYKKIDEYTKLKQLIELEYADNEKERELKLLELDKKFQKIDQLEYEKRLNDINKNPWAKIHFNYNEEEDPGNIQTEIVYNEYFIKKLQEQGYIGNTNDDIVPPIKPIRIATLNVNISLTPKTNSDNTAINVVIDVIIFLTNILFKLLLTIFVKSSFDFTLFLFSLILSKITIVSFIE